MYTTKHIKTIQTLAFLSLSCIFSNVTASTNETSCAQFFAQQEFQSALQQCTEEAKQHSSANVILAKMYEKGSGVMQNSKKSESYYLTAVLENNIDAQIAIGKLRASNDKVLQSHVFFSLAVDNGSQSAISLKASTELKLSSKELKLSKQFLQVVKQAQIKDNLQNISMIQQ